MANDPHHTNQSGQSTQAGEKLQKILARAGYGSRREIEKLIAAGEVQINGKLATLGDRALASDVLKINGKPVNENRLAKQATRVLLYNKPEGEVCTKSDEKGRNTIFDHLPRIINGRWINVGRLDLNTSGLLLITNNGELANRLMHPSYEVEREYTVRVFGEVPDEVLHNLKKGVKLEDGMAKFDKVFKLPDQEEDAMNQWYRVIIKEGRNREVRRIWESQGVQISRLIRTRYGQFSLNRGLRKGKTQELGWKEVNQLLKSVELPGEKRPDLFHQKKNTDPKPTTKRVYKKRPSPQRKR